MTATKDLDAELRRAREESLQLREENSRLRRENARLRAQPRPLPAGEGPAFQLQLLGPSQEEPVTDYSSDANRISLFRKLFRGREDVYAVRWENYASGRSGYAPASRSREDRERGLFLPLTDHVLQAHLDGRHTIGVYALLRDETCWFLAADFDKEHWQKDVATYLAACDALGVPSALERSRSGNGGHVWIFFEAPISAAQARKLGCILLTRAIAERHQIGLDSYDRLFPSQDTLPKGGFGNLIALPLQAEPRRKGNSVFLDRTFEPDPDQWAFLSGIRRMRPAEVDALVAVATRAGTVLGVRPSFVGAEGGEDPWTLPPSGRRQAERVTGPFPSSVRVTVPTWSMSPKRACLRQCSADSGGSPPSRTPSSIAPKRCDYTPLASRACSAARKNSSATSGCHAAAWTTCRSCWRPTELASIS